MIEPHPDVVIVDNMTEQMFREAVDWANGHVPVLEEVEAIEQLGLPRMAAFDGVTASILSGYGAPPELLGERECLEPDKASLDKAAAAVDALQNGCLTPHVIDHLLKNAVEVTKPEHRFAYVTVTNELLCQSLRFPPGTRIISAEVDLLGSRDLKLFVEHSDLPVCAEIAVHGLTRLQIPQASPQYRISPKRINDTEFIGWGL